MSTEIIKQSRRDFLDSFITFFSFITIGLMAVLTGNFYKLLKSNKRTISIPISQLKMGLNSFDNIFIIQGKEKPAVLDRKCPHLGCTVEFNPSEKLIQCPCHGSTFDAQGKYIRGPAKRDLKEYEFIITEDQQIRVDL